MLDVGVGWGKEGELRRERELTALNGQMVSWGNFLEITI